MLVLTVFSNSCNHFIRKRQSKYHLQCTNCLPQTQDASPGWTDRVAQNHSLGPDHKSHAQFGPLWCETAALVSWNTHLAAGLKGMARGTKILPWRNGNRYSTKLHIRANNFQSWGAFLRCLGLRKVSPGMHPTAIFLIRWHIFGVWLYFKFKILYQPCRNHHMKERWSKKGCGVCNPPQAISDGRKRNRRRVHAAPALWSWGCWRARWFKLGLQHRSLVRSSNKAALCLRVLIWRKGKYQWPHGKLKNKVCKVVHSASSKPRARSLAQCDAGVPVALLPHCSTFQIPS